MAIRPNHAYMPATMQIPGHIDPVVTPRAITPRADGRIDLLGLSHLQIRELFMESQLDEKAAKLRSKQVFHWIYHRGVTDFEMMTDIAKTMRPWLAQRFVIGRPQVVEAQLSSDGTRKWLLRTDDALPTALTYRRRRRVIRTTPTGGAFTVEVEEEVG